MKSKLFSTATMESKVFLTATIVVLVLSGFIAFKQLQIKPSSHEDKYLSEFERLLLEDAVGPESFAFDPLGGGPYTGISDGRIIKWQQDQRRWVNFATTSPHRDGCEGPQDHDRTEHICGRPLGLRFKTSTGDLYIADAYMGLLVVGSAGGGVATKLATQAEGLPLGFTNSLDIDQHNGVVYFTDSSTQYPRRNHISVILSGDKTGRLMKYDLESKQVTVLLNNLSFPNGVLLGENSHYILVAETSRCRVIKYWLETSKAGTHEVFAQLPGFPDNLNWSPRGGFWVAIHSRKGRILEWVLSYPSIGNALLKLPFDIMEAYSYLAKWRGSGLAMRLSVEGEILERLEDKSGNRLKSLAEVHEKDGTLWIGSVTMPFAAKYKIDTSL